MTHRRLVMRVYGARADLPLADVSGRPLSRLDRKALALADAPPSLFPTAGR